MKLILEAIKVLFRKVENSIATFSWNDLKDKPFYTEMVQNPYTILENEEMGYDGEEYITSNITVPRGFEAGDTVSVVLSGGDIGDSVTYTGVVVENPGTRFNERVEFNGENEHGVRCGYSTDSSSIYVASNTHANATVILPNVLVEEGVIHPIEPKYLPNSVWMEKDEIKINCDLMVKGKPGGEVRVIQGSYAAAKAKVMAGLPATVFVQLDISDESSIFIGYGNEVWPLYYLSENGEEHLCAYAPHYSVEIYPDGTASM